MNVSCHNANAPICFIKQCRAISKEIELCENCLENKVSYKNVIPSFSAKSQPMYIEIY